MDGRSAAKTYWRANQILIAILLVIWFVVSFGFAILFADKLYDVKIGALPASFWWAHQGAMIVFVLLILVYALVMDRLDRTFGTNSDKEAGR